MEKGHDLPFQNFRNSSLIIIFMEKIKAILFHNTDQLFTSAGKQIFLALENLKKDGGDV